MGDPKLLENPLFVMLREGRAADFNGARPQGSIDLRDANLRGSDLRGADFAGVDLEGAYLRNADLRGLDLTACNLRHASMASAQISGALMPRELSALEIRMSVELGTRMRYAED